LPIGAIGGRADVMDHLSPLGPVFHAGTLSGNPLATAAGLAALDVLTDDIYVELLARAGHLAAGLRDAFAAAGVTAQVPVVATLVGLRFAAGDARDYDDAKQTDEALYGRFFHEMLSRGVALAPGAYEVLFPGWAHTDDLLDQIIERAADAVSALTARSR
jgi:glutamate-1-semialdehyde 2,1-aminomutase